MTRGSAISTKKRREWLERYEGGEGYVEIAQTEKKKRSEVIRENVERARRERQAERASIAMLRDRLEAHQQMLLRAVAAWEERLVVQPPERLASLKAFWGPNGASPLGLGAELTTQGHLQYTLGHRPDDDTLTQQLVEEHVRSSGQTWKPIYDWLKSYNDYMRTCGDLGDLALKLARKHTGLESAPEAMNQEGFHQGFIEMGCQIALAHPRRPIPTAVWQALRISEDQVQFGGTVIATARGGDESRRKVSEAFKAVAGHLRTAQMARDAARIRTELEESIRGHRATLARLRLGQLLPGTCTVCKNFGR